MSTYLYILQNTEGKYYVGVTERLDDRLEEHNRGQCFSTRNKGPWKIVYTELHVTKGAAMKREGQIKRKKRKSYIEWLITNQYGRVV